MILRSWYLTNYESMHKRNLEAYGKLIGKVAKSVKDIEPPDNISYFTMLLSSIGLFVGFIMMVASPGSDLLNLGGIIFIVAAINPLRRLINSIRTYPDQTITILARLLLLRVFILAWPTSSTAGHGAMTIPAQRSGQRSAQLSVVLAGRPGARTVAISSFCGC